MTQLSFNGTIGAIAFEAYKKKVNGVAYDGTPIPDWGMLKREIQLAWEEAAFAVRTADQGMRLRAEIEQRLADYINWLATATPEEDMITWLHLRARELVWLLRSDLDNVAGAALVQKMIEQEKEKKLYG